jgi:hypothetical protein
MANVEGPYTDEGTGAYEGPPAEVTYESNVSADPTSAVEGPPAEVTVESPAGDEVTASTGAVEGPPPEVTTYAWPAEAPDEKKASRKAVRADEVEDKAVRASRTTKK